MINRSRIDTEGLRICAENVSDLRRFTSEISDYLQNARAIDPEWDWSYRQCLQKAEKMGRFFLRMHDLLLEISEDTEATLKKIIDLMEQHMENACPHET